MQLILFRYYEDLDTTVGKMIISEKIFNYNELEKIIYELIKNADLLAESLSVDNLIMKTKLDSAKINSTLTILELNGAIQNENGFLKLLS